jgi:uncharacterized protein DUF6298
VSRAQKLIILVAIGALMIEASIVAAKPLRVHPFNSRYFTDDGDRAIYLTGSHTWNNLQDRGTAESVRAFDYVTYLNFLQEYNHNFIRLWAWEHTRTNATEHFSPSPYQRTGPGVALDGKPKFDVTRFDQSYFDRLRARVRMAGERGIYVSIMLFQGWSIESKKAKLDPWTGHPFNKANNSNGIDGDENNNNQGEEIHTLRIPAIVALQEAYVRKIIDSVNDCDNVLYEIANESPIASKDWQSHMVLYIKSYETQKPKQHLVGMTYFYNGRAGAMDELMAGPADWVSPGNDGTRFDYGFTPPVAEGRKIIISDTDHFFGVGGDRSWVWKSFTRGLHPTYMDPYGNANFPPADESARRAMGQTLVYAQRIDLASMTPRPELCSTQYCLVNPGREYLIYLTFESPWPEPGVESVSSWVNLRLNTLNLFHRTVAVNLSGAAEASTLEVEWFNPATSQYVSGRRVASGAWHSFTAPFPGDAILYLFAV